MSCLRCLQALGEEVAFRVVASVSKRRAEMTARMLVPLGAKLELTERRPIEWVRIETIPMGDTLDLLEPPIRSISLSDCDSAVESDDRRRANHHQRIVKGYYLSQFVSSIPREVAWTNAIAASM